MISALYYNETVVLIHAATDDSFMFDPTLLDDIFANAMEEAKENVQSEIVSKLTKKLMKKVESI